MNMKKRTFILGTLLVAMMTLVSCDKDKDSSVTVKLFFDVDGEIQSQTKAIDCRDYVIWEEGDSIHFYLKLFDRKSTERDTNAVGGFITKPIDEMAYDLKLHDGKWTLYKKVNKKTDEEESSTEVDCVTLKLPSDDFENYYVWVWWSYRNFKDWVTLAEEIEKGNGGWFDIGGQGTYQLSGEMQTITLRPPMEKKDAENDE